MRHPARGSQPPLIRDLRWGRAEHIRLLLTYFAGFWAVPELPFNVELI